MSQTKEITTTEQNQSILKLLAQRFNKEHRFYIYVLALAPILFATRTFEGAFLIGIILTFVVLLTYLVVALTHQLIPSAIKIPVYLLVLATEITIFQMITQAFFVNLATELGIYFSLIAVNIVLFAKVEETVEQNNLKTEILKGLKFGSGILTALAVIGLFREVLGTGAITFGNFLPFGQITITLFPSNYALSILARPAGAFLISGSVLATAIAIQQAKEEK